MDDDDFFDFSKEFKRTTVRAGYVNGRKAIDEGDFEIKSHKKPHIGKDYAIEHRMKAENIMLEASMMDSASNCSRMDSIDDDIDSSNPKYKSEILEIYEKYNFDITDGTTLPINSSKFNILQTIDNNPAVILQGPTGCGKSTQVPQYILDEARRRNKYCNIIVTQPRKIAAISLAKRVCDERQWQVGTIVGHQVGLNAQIHNDTRLLYCTTGILLQKLISTKSLTTYTHIILDEVHERDSDMDFLLIVIKKLLSECYNKVKIILMSATIDTFEFSEYFKTPRMGIFENAPIINVDRKRIYTVKEFYLCQLGRLKPVNGMSVEVDYNEPGISEEMYMTAIRLLVVCGRFDETDNNLNYKPSILVFLPGVYEIEYLFKKINQSQKESNDTKEFIVLPLHSLITTEEQEKIFKPPPTGCRKIILATNIAESSITVPDIKYVIDFCLTKNLMTDPTTNFTSLKMQWASKANCNQRSGRAGRVMNGRVYRLVSKRFFDFTMQESGVPEILRCPLEQIVLKAKILDMGPPHSILALAMNAPNLSDIGNTISVLKSVGALYRTVAGNYDALDGDITYLGRVMSGLPLDIRASKLIILGYVFNVLEETIIIASGLNVRNIFAKPFQKDLEAYYQKLLWADGSGSDLFAILNAYTVWKKKKQQNLFQNDVTERLWGDRYFIQIRAMWDLAAQIEEIKQRLKRYNMTDIKSNEKAYWTNQEKYLVLKIVICGAFYPYYFHRSSINERDAFHVLAGLDPSKTVYFKGMDPKYIGVLYEKRIKKLLDQITQPSDIKITFDSNSQRLFATFLKGDQFFNRIADKQLHLVNSMPGNVLLEVYKACKMAKINSKHQIEVLTPTEAIKYAKNHQIGVIENGTWYPKKEKLKKLYRITPALNEKEMQGIVPHVEHCSKFFFQPNSTMEVLKDIHDNLRPECLVPFVQPADINESEIIAAPYTSDIHDGVDHISYYRVKLLGFHKEVAESKYFTVYYIDYGNTGSVKFSDLRRAMFVDVLKNIPPCVFECYLSGIQPSCFASPQELWTENANKQLIDFKNRSKDVTIEIFSFVNGVAAVRLKKGNLCINDILVNKGLAQVAEENYLSKANHELRERKQTSKLEDNLSDNMNNEDEDLNKDDINPPPLELCHQRVTLLGPCSPLETQMFSLMKFAEYNSAKIDGSSINSVLLDTLSSSDSRKLIVAAEVGSQNNSTLIARNTTLMPNIKGFDVLMGLLFCPTMELKRDPKNTRYAAALTGLGYNQKTLEPLDSEHDILFKMDVDISVEDLEKINAIRYYMDSLLHTYPGDDYPQLPESAKIQIMNKIIQKLPEILEKPRQSVEVVTSRNDGQWGNVKEEDMIKMPDLYGFRTIFPLHVALQLEEPKSQDTIRLRNNCTELHKIARLNVLSIPFTCLLCNQTLENITQVRIHLFTFLHVDREKQIHFQK